MLKRFTRRIAHGCAVVIFSLLEVLGLPKLHVRNEEDSTR